VGKPVKKMWIKQEKLWIKIKALKIKTFTGFLMEYVMSYPQNDKNSLNAKD
jgi:hypothetical protein